MNLTTTYLGFKLRTPLVPSASPLTEHLDNIKRLEDAGAPPSCSIPSLRSNCDTIDTNWIFISIKARKVSPRR